LLVAIPSVAGSPEDIALNNCKIRGADSYGHDSRYRMCRYKVNADGYWELNPNLQAWAFQRAKFLDNGDEFSMSAADVDPNNTARSFATVHFQYQTTNPGAKLKIVFTPFNEDEPGDPEYFTLQSGNALQPGWIGTVAWEDYEGVLLPMTSKEFHISLEGGSAGYPVRLLVDQITSPTSYDTYKGNWNVTWRDMDFDPGDAVISPGNNNFDCVHFAHERDTDYIEFTTQMTGENTLYAFCKKHHSEPCTVRVKVNGNVKQELTIQSADYAWNKLWTGTFTAGDTIRIENNQWTESGGWFRSDTFHDSFISFANDSHGGAAFKILPVGSPAPTAPGPQKPPPPAVPTLKINNGDADTSFADVTLTITGIPADAEKMKIVNLSGDLDSTVAKPVTLAAHPIPHKLIKFLETQDGKKMEERTVSVYFYRADNSVIRLSEGTLQPRIEDSIKLNLADARIAPFARSTTAFSTFNIHVTDITENVEHVNIYYADAETFAGASYDIEIEDSHNYWKFYHTVWPAAGQTEVLVPFQGEPQKTYCFRLRIWAKSSGQYHDPASYDEPDKFFRCIEVKPHNLQVTVSEIKDTSATIAWRNDNCPAFESYALYVDSSPLVDTPKNKRVYYNQSLSDLAGSTVDQNVLNNLAANTQYYYILVAQPKEQAAPVKIDGRFKTLPATPGGSRSDTEKESGGEQPPASTQFKSDGRNISGWYWLRDSERQHYAEWVIPNIPAGSGDIVLEITALATDRLSGGGGQPADFALEYGPWGSGAGSMNTTNVHLPNISPPDHPLGYTCRGEVVLPRSALQGNTTLYLRAKRTGNNHVAFSQESIVVR
jgi:hypothetical protein